MKKLFGAALAAAYLLVAPACSSQNSAVVNGEKIKLEDGLYANFQTSKGDILIKLEFQKTPMTVGNFVALAEGKMKTSKPEGTPFYDGTIFHRVIPNFMIQGGDPLGTGAGDPGYKFPDEIDPSLKHDAKGVLSMANSGPNTNGSQFFITQVETPWLDGRHTVFGKAIAGQNTIDSIVAVPRGAQDRPNTDVVLQKVSIVRVGKEAKAFDGMAAFNAGQAKLEAAKAEKAAAQEAALAQYKANAEVSPSGLMYIIETVGDGPKPKDGDIVYVHYAGYLLDGTLFDSSIKEIAQANNKYDARREPYGPLPLEYGPQGRVIEGWKEGIKLLNVGGKAKLIIPPHLGYGAREIPGVIPANSTLVFDVELVSVDSK